MALKDINSMVVTAANPCLLVYMLDCSASMLDTFGNNADITKAQALTDAINKAIYEAGMRCVAGSGELKSKFEIALFAYGDEDVYSGWEGPLSSKFVHPIVQIFDNPMSSNDEGFPQWIQPNCNGGTPMLAAFNNVKDLVEDWINWGNHREICHPPIIINVTDGEATDDDNQFSGIRKTVNQIKSMGTDYGNAIVMNIHISGRRYDKILFPNNPVGNNAYEKLLYDISSPLYSHMIEQGRKAGFKIPDDARGYVFNGDSSDLIRFINVGTNSGNVSGMNR